MEFTGLPLSSHNVLRTGATVRSQEMMSWHSASLERDAMFSHWQALIQKPGSPDFFKRTVDLSTCPFRL